jgi:putative restriction endonuclease
MTDDDVWFRKLGNLKIDRAKGPAPHKPLLLLVILELAERGQLPLDCLPLTAELTFLFGTFWRVVAHRRKQRPDVCLPFHHLQSDGFWSAEGEDHQPSPGPRFTEFARLDPEFAAFALRPESRERARRILISTYFEPAERLTLYALVGLPVPSEEEIERDANEAAARKAQEQGRDVRFRVDVVTAYNYTCALTGYRLMIRRSAGTIVDAAHIHQFAHSRNNEVQNGLALCKNPHWLFDNGLWTVEDDHTIRVATDQFSEDHTDHKSLGEYAGRKLRLPSNPELWPSPVHLDWHRKHRYLGR